MWKRFIAFLVCIVLLTTAVSGADLWEKDGAPQVSDDTLMVLVSALNDSKYVYYNNEPVFAGMNLYDKALTAKLYDKGMSILEFQVAVSTWFEVDSLYFISSNNDVASIDVRLTEEGTHVFTLKEVGNGTATISMTLNDSDPLEIFQITIGDAKDYIEKNDYDYILQEAKKRIPSIVIVDKKENIVSGKSSNINIGESETYHVAISTTEWNSNTIGFSFYNNGGYYFYLDTERIKWTTSGKHVTSKTDGYGIILNGISGGEDSLKAEVPVSVVYLQDEYLNKDYYNKDKDVWIEGQDSMGLYGYKTWDIESLTIDATIKVIENKPEKKHRTTPLLT